MSAQKPSGPPPGAAGQKPPDIKEIMADYDKAVKFFANTPAEAWEALGQKTALSVFQETAKTIPAYQEFLKLQKFDPESVKSIEDFYKVPVMDKYNYIQAYGFNEVNSVKAGKDLYSFSLSSGTVNEPTIWPRYYQHEEFLPLVVGNYLRLYWQIEKKSTLLINAFALGPWAAGFTMHQAVRPLTQKYQLTLATTGADIDSIIYTVVKLSKHYNQVIIFSYPTFLRTILDRLLQAQVDLKSLNLKLFVGGEGYTVDWWRYINKLISGNPENLTAIIDAYGTADGSLMGMGSAFTSLIRDLASKNDSLCHDLFGKANCVPDLFQYSTASYLMEEINGEVVFTSKGTAPLIRYNLHDRGGVIKFRDMEEILKKHGYDYKKLIKKQRLPEEIVWQQPFVYCFGRREDTVILGGANVFPEEIAPVLFNEKNRDIHSFKLIADHDKEQHLIFCILIELKAGITYNKKQIVKIERKYHDIIVNYLRKSSLDYDGVYRDDPKTADPKIEIFESGTGPFVNDINRTKPRLVLKK